MTLDEIETFKENIANTILPHVQYMNNEQILNIIQMVVKENTELPFGFGEMLFEQILLLKN